MTNKKNKTKNEIILWTLTAVVLSLYGTFSKIKCIVLKRYDAFLLFCQFSFIKSARPDSFCSVAYFSGFFIEMLMVFFSLIKGAAGRISVTIGSLNIPLSARVCFDFSASSFAFRYDKNSGAIRWTTVKNCPPSSVGSICGQYKSSNFSYGKIEGSNVICTTSK